MRDQPKPSKHADQIQYGQNRGRLRLRKRRKQQETFGKTNKPKGVLQANFEVPSTFPWNTKNNVASYEARDKVERPAGPAMACIARQEANPLPRRCFIESDGQLLEIAPGPHRRQRTSLYHDGLVHSPSSMQKKTMKCPAAQAAVDTHEIS